MSFLRDRGYDYAIEEVWKSLGNHQMPTARAVAAAKGQVPFLGADEHNRFTVACKHCGETGLRWKKNQYKQWRLYGDRTGEQHHCEGAR